MKLLECKEHQILFGLYCYHCRVDKIREALEFYANQLLDYNEVVSQELLDDKGQKARDLLDLLQQDAKPKS